MQIHELYTSSEARQNALGTSVRYQVSKILPLSSTLYILERVGGKICIHLSKFSGTEALCSKNISIMPALCPMLHIVLCSKLCGIIRQTLMPIWLLCCESEAIFLKKFRPGHLGVFIWEKFSSQKPARSRWQNPRSR